MQPKGTGIRWRGRQRHHVGTLELQVQEGNYFPSLLEPRRRSERDLLAVVQQVYLEGVSTRRV